MLLLITVKTDHARESQLGILKEMFWPKKMVHDNIPSGFAAEAITCLQAVTVGRDLGMKYVEIEGGSLIVIKKVKNPNKDKSAIGSYIHDIKEQNVTFYECKFQHAMRAANKSAHNLASERLKMGKNA